MSWRQNLNKSTAKSSAPKPKFDTKDDDWETDTTYENSVTEKTQRYGSTSIPGSGRVDHIDFNSIQEKIKSADSSVTDVYQDKNPNRGYGGKYGVEQVMDKNAADFSYKSDIKKHSSQTDGKKGFGGEHGIDERAKDKSAVGFDYKPTVEKHSSQTDASKGFGGEHGIDERAKDKSAVGFDYKPTAEKHSSQTDASKGFGGKYGTEQNVQDKSAVGFAHKEALPKHSSQTDYTAGFGGKYGVQKDEPASPAVTIVAPPPSPSTPAAEPKIVEKSVTPTSSKADVGNIRARFENIKKEQEAEAAKRVAEERKKRATTDQQLQEKQQASTNNQEKVKQKETAPKTREPSPPRPQTPPTTREPSPPRPQTPPTTREPSPPPPEVSSLNLNENDDNKEVETSIPTTIEEKKEEPVKFVGSVDVTALLRQRKTSSSSSKNDEDDDDEWAVDKNETTQ